jgi:hypothetical protein
MCEGAQRPLNPRTILRLKSHRADHATITGQPFQHFFCPILFIDEDTELMQGHVINEGFKGSPGTWAVQRKDVDNFFGAFFESDYLLSQRMAGKRVLDFFFDKVLFRLARPEIYFQKRKLHYFLRFGKDRAKPIPDGFVTLDINHSGQEVQLCIRDDGLTETPSVQHLDFVTVKDLRLPAFVSLLKAAHLSMFSLFGYRYVYSDAGKVIGQNLLGAFYKANRHIEDKLQIQDNALAFFRPYRFMVAPLFKGSTNLSGSITDRVFELCAGSTRLAWGMIVYVKTSDLVSAVMIPMPDDPAAMEVFLDFIKNDHEEIRLMIGQYHPEPGEWRVNPERRVVTWLKNYDAYPLTIRRSAPRWLT